LQFRHRPGNRPVCGIDSSFALNIEDDEKATPESEPRRAKTPPSVELISPASAGIGSIPEEEYPA